MLENSTALLLVNGLLGGSIVLLAGGLLSLFVREPVYRLRLAGVTLLCTVLAIGVAALPAMPRWSPLTSAQQEAVQNVVTLPPPKAGGQMEAASATFPPKNVEAVFPAGHELNGSSVGVFSVEDDLSASPTSTAVTPSSAAVSQFSQPVLPPEFVPQLVQVFIKAVEKSLIVKVQSVFKKINSLLLLVFIIKVISKICFKSAIHIIIMIV